MNWNHSWPLAAVALFWVAVALAAKFL